MKEGDTNGKVKKIHLIITFLSIILNIIAYTKYFEPQNDENNDPSYLVVVDNFSSNIYKLLIDKTEWRIAEESIIKGMIGQVVSFEKNNVIISDSEGFKYRVRVSDIKSFCLNDKLLVLYSTTGEESLVSPKDFPVQYCYFKLDI